jgi:hypothetical protein
MDVIGLVVSLKALEDVLGPLQDISLGSLHALSLDIAPASDVETALLADSNGVVGVIVRDDNGAPALLAGEFNGD